MSVATTLRLFRVLSIFPPQDIYRTGVLHLNTDMCALVLQKDLEYWQIDELILGEISTEVILSVEL